MVVIEGCHQNDSKLVFDLSFGLKENECGKSVRSVASHLSDQKVTKKVAIQCLLVVDMASVGLYQQISVFFWKQAHVQFMDIGLDQTQGLFTGIVSVVSICNVGRWVLITSVALCFIVILFHINPLGLPHETISAASGTHNTNMTFVLCFYCILKHFQSSDDETLF